MTSKLFYSVSLVSVFLLFGPGCKKTGSAPQPVVADPQITYEVSTAIFPNPERGFIKTFPVYAEGDTLRLPVLNLLRGQNVSLVLRFFYFDKFKATALSAAELQLIQTDMKNLRIAGLKAILRFGYTDDMTGTDAPLAIIEQHLDQLKPIFEANKDVIAFMQAGFIGAYGEWHTSSNGLSTIPNQAKVLNKILSVLPVEIMVQVRTPAMKQQIFNNTQPLTKELAYTAESRARVGHHNDCFLSGGNEYGTYNNVSLEKQYISNEANYVPVGGETCPPTGGYSPNCVEGQKEMKLLKWTYLNLDWYTPTISAWKSSGCFDEFQKYLGHRLALVKSGIATTAKLNGNLKVSVVLNNKGYAPLYMRKKTALVLKNKTTGVLYTILLAVDLREAKPSVDFSIDETINLSNVPAGQYDTYLRIADNAASLENRIEYAIQLANTGVWVTENGGMNSLKHTLTITAQ
jgi:hypothetical protein